MTAVAEPTLYGRVPTCWPGSTVVCIGTGPSLTAEDVAFCQGRAKVLAIKHAIELAPWADVLYSCGSDAGKWWQRNGDSLRHYQGLRFTLDPAAARWATVLRNTGFVGLESSPDGVRTGKNSGYQAINVAVHLGATRIVLLGYDMQTGAQDQDHYFGQHWHGGRVPLQAFRGLFDTLVAPLAALGVQVLNASRRTALESFPTCSLDEALA